jgi:hypothetical protein
MSRHYTNLLYQAVEDGLIDAKSVMEMAMSYMSEDEVHDMMRVNDLLYYLEAEEEEEEDIDCDDGDEDYDDSMDGDWDSGMASAGFGTDEDYGYAGDEY